MRTMVAPGVWRDEGPAAAKPMLRYSSIHATSGAQMLPVMGLPTVNDRRHAAAKARREPERCGRFMPRLKVPCYRRKGHKDYCQSEAYVVAWNDYRSRR